MQQSDFLHSASEDLEDASETEGPQGCLMDLGRKLQNAARPSALGLAMICGRETKHLDLAESLHMQRMEIQPASFC